MPTDLPDYTEYMAAPPQVNVYVELPSISHPATPTMGLFQMTHGTSVKTPESLTTDYIKRAIILPSKVVVADPTGAIVSYEGGWVCRALIHKAGAGEVALAKDVLDEFVKLQLADGSWCQQYYPTKGKDGKFPCYARAGEPYKDIQVDSGAGLLAWAMADYDYAISPGVSDVYKTPVQKAMQFLRECQYAHTVSHSTYLLANQRWDYVAGSPTWNKTALAADCAECLLSMKRALDQYGSDLTTSGGYSVRQMANDLYKAIVIRMWLGDQPPSGLNEYYFRTEYPAGRPVWLMPADIVPQGISYTQALCAWAVYDFANSGYRLAGYADYSQVCKRALNWTIAILQGKWGGFYYHPIGDVYGRGISGDGIGLYDEFPAFTALMTIAMNIVDSTYYADRITRAVNFIQLASITGGRVYNRVKIDGLIDLGEAGVAGDGMHFRALNCSQGLLADA